MSFVIIISFNHLWRTTIIIFLWGRNIKRWFPYILSICITMCVQKLIIISLLCWWRKIFFFIICPFILNSFWNTKSVFAFFVLEITSVWFYSILQRLHDYYIILYTVRKNLFLYKYFTFKLIKIVLVNKILSVLKCVWKFLWNRWRNQIVKILLKKYYIY